MIFEKGDKILFDKDKRECICCDEEFAVFGRLYTEQNGDKSVSFEDVIIVSNEEEFEDVIEYKRV